MAASEAFVRAMRDWTTENGALLLEQAGANRGVVDACRDSDGVELRQTVYLVDNKSEAHGLEPSLQRLMIASVSCPGVFQAFFLHHQERFVQRVHGVYRCGVP